MEDSNAVTIEFLRARLLSERSVSRSAKQRADELAKRVDELEEQLKIVSLQRKLAEKATADVLAILEDRGISEDEYDFSSDHEIPYEPGAGDISTKEEKPFDSNIRRSVSCEPSVSDHESSLKSGRSLSWKGRDDSPSSLEKYRNPNTRRRGSWTNFRSAPKHCSGKSCRQIRRKENRSLAERYSDGCAKDESEQNKIAHSSEEVPNSFPDGSSIFREDPQIQVEKVVSEVISSNNDHYPDGYEIDKDMEKALKHQAQLIGQYEAMEKAQREWEEKFREHLSSTSDSFDPGNHSDITEERDDVKAQVPYYDREMQITNSQGKAVCFSKEVCGTTPHSCMPTSDADKEFNSYQNAFASASGALSQHFPVSATKGKQCLDAAENSCHQLPEDCQQPSHCSPQYKSENVPQSYSNDGLTQEVPSVIGHNPALFSHEQPHQLHTVLNSLKQAKLALQQKINTLPLIEWGHSEKAIEPSLTLAKTREKFEIPVGFSGLFRLPTEVSEKSSRPNFLLSSPSHLHSENSYYDKAIACTSGDKYAPSHNVHTEMSFFLDDPSLTRRDREACSRLDIQKPHVDPYAAKGMLPSTAYSVPSYPSHHSYQDLMQQTSSRASLSLSGGVPPAGHFYYNNNVYR